MTAYSIDVLSRHHDKTSFCSGVEELDNYLQKQANQDAKRHVAATFVLTEESSNIILGYYTLSSASIKHDKLPTDLAKKLPKYPFLPATLLGRLAVDERHRRKKLGELLLISALKRSLQLSKEIASMAVIVDAKNEEAINFYLHYGFMPFADEQTKLFLPMNIIEQL